MTPSHPSPTAPLRRFWRLGGVEWHELLALLVGAIGLLVFIAIADEVGDGAGADAKVLAYLRPSANPHDALGPAWFEHAVAELTTFGGTANLTVIVVVAVLFLLIQRRIASALLVTFALGGGVILSEGVKALVGGGGAPQGASAGGASRASFPSGHAMLSTVTYLTLGALLAQVMPKKRLKAFVFAVAVLLALIVGASRVYLGVHWLTDVLAGWSLGAAWAMICWLAARRIRRSLRRHPGVISEPPVKSEQP